MFIKVPLCVVKCGGDFTFLITHVLTIEIPHVVFYYSPSPTCGTILILLLELLPS